LGSRACITGDRVSAVLAFLGHNFGVNAEVGRFETDSPAIATADIAVDQINSQSTAAWRRFALGFMLAAVGVALMVTAGALAFERMNADKVLPGVNVAGVSVSGLTRSEAEAALRAELPDLRSGAITIDVAGTSDSIMFSEIHRDYDIDAMIDSAIAAGRGAGLLAELRSLFQDVSVPVQIGWDQQALMDSVVRLAAAEEVAAADARLEVSSGRYSVVPAVDGLAVDEQQVYEAAAAIVADPTRESGTITASTRVVPAAVSTDAATAAVERLEKVVSEPLTIKAGTETTVISADTLRRWVRLEPAGTGEWTLAVERAPLAQLVAALAPRLEVEAENATFTFEGGAAKVIPGTDGQQLDVAASTSAAFGALTGRADGVRATTVNLALIPLPAEFSTADAQALVSSVRMLGTWTTKFTPSPFNGDGINIRTPAKLIDGTVVEPGESFDFVEAAGPFTRRNGYTDGAAIIHGNTKMDGVLGGGLCSASTTLFNAVARAGFQIDARHNHYYYIGRYPVGLDATIWVNGRIYKTFAFTNDSEHPLLIRAEAKRRSVTFEIWGVPDGRTVSFSEPRIEDETEAKTYIEYTDELPAGVRERAEFATDGFDSWVSRTVRDSSGAVIHDDTWFSNYGKVDGVILQGRSATDPPAGTRVVANNL
jgi:vancomycin resistance protein YoaR